MCRRDTGLEQGLVPVRTGGCRAIPGKEAVLCALGLEQGWGPAPPSRGLSSADLNGRADRLRTDAPAAGAVAPPAELTRGPGHTWFLSHSVPHSLCARSLRRGGAAEGRPGRERLPDGVLDRALLLLPLGHADLTPLPPRRSPSAMQAPHSCPDFFLLL